MSVIAITLATLLITLDADAALATPIGCETAVLKGSAKLAEKTHQILRKCHTAALQAPGRVCSDSNSALKLAGAKRRLDSQLSQACGGNDGQCGTGDDDALSSIGWDIGECPNFLNSDCR